MNLICQILFPSRCSKCLSKVYCSKECQVGGWKAGHKEFCSAAVDARKVKHTDKERRQAERDSVKKTYVKFKETNKDTDKGKEWTKEAKKMCNKMKK